MSKQTFFIFVRVELGQTYTVGRQVLKDVPYVKEVASISGKWDLLVKLEIDGREDVGELINTRLAGIPGIRQTKTMVAYAVYDKEDVFF